MDDHQLMVLQDAVADLPEPEGGHKTVVHQHPQWREMAEVIGLIVMEYKGRPELVPGPDDFDVDEKWGHRHSLYPYGAINEELEEGWGVTFEPKALKKFIRNTVEKALVSAMVPTEWHRKMALRAQGRLDTVAQGMEQADAAARHAQELLEKRGEVVYESDGKMRVTASHSDVTSALKEWRMANETAHGLLASIGMAPPLSKKGDGTTVNVNQAFGVDSGSAFQGFGKRPGGK